MLVITFLQLQGVLLHAHGTLCDVIYSHCRETWLHVDTATDSTAFSTTSTLLGLPQLQQRPRNRLRPLGFLPQVTGREFIHVYQTDLASIWSQLALVQHWAAWHGSAWHQLRSSMTIFAALENCSLNAGF